MTTTPAVDPRTDTETARLALAAALDDARHDVARLRALVVEVVTAAWTAKVPHHPEWLTDDLWARLVAETPKPDTYTDRPAPDAAPGLF